MNISRRTAIKGIGAGIASTTMAHTTLANTTKASAQAAINSTDTFRVQVAHRWGQESLAAVIKNTSPHPATITNINPVAAEYGRFDFEKLTKGGPLTLAAGEEVQVPFKVMGTPVKAFGHFDQRLQIKLKQSLVISTQNSSATVSTTLNPRIV